jgi:type VI secretion system protein ImpH
MATEHREKTADLIEEMAQRPFQFDFFRAIRLLEASLPPGQRLGKTLWPRDDAIRFGQVPSLSFAPSTLDSISRSEEGIPKLRVNFFGLFGPNGPLPLYLTEHARDRLINAHDPTLVAFADVLHHRLLSLFYRAWAVNQKSVDLDRQEHSRFSVYFGSLFGFGTEGLFGRDSIPDRAKLYYSGRLVSQTRNAEGLQAIIQEFFGLPTEIQPFVGQWLQLPPGSECKLGATRDSGTLGRSAIIGSRIWECQLRFRIRLGPLGLADLMRMLPTTDAFRRLKDWVLNYLNRELAWDVQLVLRKDEVPSISLGKAGQLGWTTWLKSKPFAADAEDVILQGETCA